MAKPAKKLTLSERVLASAAVAEEFKMSPADRAKLLKKRAAERAHNVGTKK
jgi:hypothetical protein